jgi:hypothetical protein
LSGAQPGRVECRSEHTYAQQPIALWWQGQRLAVTALLVERRIPEGRAFRVKTDSGQVFELVYIETNDEWSIQEV